MPFVTVFNKFLRFFWVDFIGEYNDP